MTKEIYTFDNRELDAFGTMHSFIGPGLSKYTNHIHLLQPFNDWSREKWSSTTADRDAERIVWMLNQAYEAGRQSMQCDVKLLLGIK